MMQHKLFVKICGITNRDDAVCVAENEADAIGFNFYEKSKRYISPADAAFLSKTIPATIKKIGVFVNAEKDFISNVVQLVGLDGVQFSGNESPEAIFSHGKFSVKTIHVLNRQSIEMMTSYSVDAFLLDTSENGAYGGTGKSFDWDIALRAKSQGKIILAGGLTPDNVGRAVKVVEPFGVDVSSGVEVFPGKKDPAKVREFITNARNAAVQR